MVRLVAKADVAAGGARAARDARSGQFVERSDASEPIPTEEARVEAVLRAAAKSGLLDDKSRRIAGRVSQALVAQAKRQTGIEADTDLIAFALASVALEDPFPEAFRKARGKVSPDLDLGV